MKRLWFLVAFFVLSWSVQAISPQASAYVDTALDLLEQNFLRRDQINWQRVRAGTRERAKDAVTFKDTYPAIRWAFSQLLEPHSFFLEPQQAQTSRAVSNQPVPTSNQMGNIGYLQLPFHASDGRLEVSTYQDVVLNDMKRLDQNGVCGWIVDLSKNGGGNMYPMIAGLGALIGEGTLGHFFGADKKLLASWSYQNGAAKIGDYVAAQVKEPYQLRKANPPVAVIISNGTASSGEATAMSFIGRPNTRFFGQASAGFTTGNIAPALEDGALMVITASEMADRNSKIHPKIMPEQATNFFTVNDENHEILKWLRSQPACQ